MSLFRRWFLSGMFAAALLYLGGAVVNLTQTADRPVLGALRQVSEAMNLPLRPLYDAFHLHDDDARVIYPLLIATAAWALAGGGLAALVGWVLRRAGARRGND